MTQTVLAALFVLFAWWLGTAAILFIDGLPRWTFRFSLAGMTAVALAGLYGLCWSSRFASRPAAYVGFGSALSVWGWHELTFLMGLVTGPRKEPLPDGAHGWLRFRYAAAVVMHHEVALAATVLAIVSMTWGAPNQVGTWTFLVLWTMRLSAKLNVFLGVRNLTEEFIPTHLRYMLSYFRRAPWNPLMPVSVLAASAVVVRLASEARSADAGGFVVLGRTLVATILALAVLEHLFLALPAPDAVLWRWALRPGRGPVPKIPPPLGEEAP